MRDEDMSLTRAEVTMAIPAGGHDADGMKQKAYDLMTDVEQYPDYMPSVNALEILEREGNRLTTRWDAEIDGAPIEWVQQVRCEDADREMHFEAIQGDFDVFKGTWSVIESEGRVHLRLLIEYKLGIPVIEEVLGPILEEKIRANSEAMLGAIAARL